MEFLLEYDNNELMEKILVIQELIEKRIKNEKTIEFSEEGSSGEYYHSIFYNGYRFGRVDERWISLKNIMSGLKNPEDFFSKEREIFSDLLNFKRCLEYDSDKKLYKLKYCLHKDEDEEEDDEEVEDEEGKEWEEVKWITRRDVIDMLELIKNVVYRDLL